MKGTNVAVIGVGYWGKKIVDEYSRLSEVNIVAVSDISDKNLKFCRDRYGVERLEKDYENILNDDSISAVNVCLPNELHYPVCKAALEGGKHVLVEKPMTLSSQKGWELVRMAEERELTLSVGHIYRFNNALSEIRRLISRGFFGKIFLMNFAWKNLEPIYEDRDVIVDLAPHYFDIINYLLNDWPSHITCRARPFRREEGEETAFIVSDMKNGVMVNADLSWLSPNKIRQIEINGENRSVVIDAVGQEVTVFESGYTYNLGVRRNNTIKSELSHFLNSISNPVLETKNSGVVGVKTVEMIERAKESLEREATVSIG